MLYSSIGYYSLIFGLIISLPIFFFSIRNLKNNQILDSKIISFSFIQLFLVIVIFIFAIFLIEKIKFPSPEKKYQIDVTNEIKKL